MGTLARPRWRVGQVLQPRDLRALEGALSAEATLRAAAPGLPGYGVFDLDWNGEDPQALVVFVDALSAVFPGGTVVDVPGNARVRAPLHLGDVGKDEIDVYLHVVDPPEDDDAEEDPLAPPPETRAAIARSEHVLELSASPTLLGSQDRIPLGRFRRDAKGAYRLASDVSPPLLRVDALAALARRLERLRGELAEIEAKLDRLAADAVGRGLPLWPIQRVRVEARKLGALLADLQQGVALHPYWVFSAIRAFALELSGLDETRPPDTPAAYDHDRPWASFSTALDRVSAWLSWASPGSPRVAFVLDGAGRLAAALPDDALGAPEMYVIALKREEADLVPFDQVRLASPSRVRLVREYALQGVPFAKDPAPRFRYGFGAGADFYRLGSAGEEWDHVVRDKAIAFHPTPDLEGRRFVLCWRSP